MSEAPDIKLVEELQQDVKKLIPKLGKDILINKFEILDTIKESMKAGGPASVPQAIQEEMFFCKVGIRELSRLTNVRRSLLKKMLDGEIEIPSDVIGTIFDIFAAKKPERYKDL